MRFFDVLVASASYHGSEPLTYAWAEALSVGTLVNVHLKNESVLGIIIKEVQKPRFTVKPIERVVQTPGIPNELLDLHRWMESYYPAPMGSITELFTPPAFLKKQEKAQISAYQQRKILLPQPLTDDQARAFTIISQDLQPTLIHGDTGTGKTRIYLEAVMKALKMGKSALVLTPEISLTPQLVNTFLQHISEPVELVHSGMSSSERRKAWQRVASSTTPQVLIGPRSAIFYPVRNLGMVIVDECHDSAYKQEQSPKYHATRTAAKLAELHKAKYILGSATPSVVDYYLFQQKKLPIIRIQKPAIQNKFSSQCAVVDIKDRTLFSRSQWLSDALLSAIDKALDLHKQSLVFLNRRGTSRLVLCQTCGWEALCHRCDLPMTYHHDSHVLICHTCGRSEAVPTECARCHSTDILFKSIGTKSIESELQRLYPNSRIMRFDSDLASSEKLHTQYDDVRDGAVDIIVGTQMISKGLDLPRLGVVGIVLADTSMYFPDYTAAELTFQMINQVSGRVGRGHGDSTTIVQTYSPKSPAISAAIAKDYEGFYSQEIQDRKAYYFPPYCYTLKLRCSKKTAATAEKHALLLADSLRQGQEGIRIEGASPSFAAKVNGFYRWQIVVKAPSRTSLTRIIDKLPSGWTYDLDPVNLL